MASLIKNNDLNQVLVKTSTGQLLILSVDPDLTKLNLSESIPGADWLHPGELRNKFLKDLKQGFAAKAYRWSASS